MAQTFPKLIKNTNSQIQKAQQISNKGGGGGGKQACHSKTPEKKILKESGKINTILKRIRMIIDLS